MLFAQLQSLRAVLTRCACLAAIVLLGAHAAPAGAIVLLGDPLGACCNLMTGECTQTTQGECGGTWTGGANCSPNICPIGACCDVPMAMCRISGPLGCGPGPGFLPGATCEPNPCPGACCGPTSNCTFVSQAQCAGTWTPGVCGPNPCPGACCNLMTGGCTFVAEGACTGGPWFPGVCTPTVCPIGACCVPFTAMCTITGPTGCPPGNFLFGQTSCEPNPCPGACCAPNSTCAFISQSQCSGTWSPGVCAPNPCPGACCNLMTGECTFVAEDDCATGPWNPGVCTPTTCPIGACCVPFTAMCTITGPTGCPPGNFLFGQRSCDPNPCPGACCGPSSFCTFISQSQCSGTWSPGVCAPNPCPGACCNLMTGECTFVAEDDCATGPWNPGVCTPTICPRGACCIPSTAMCTITGPTGCPPGNFLFGQTTCTPNPCPGACCGPSSFCTFISQSQCSGTWSPGVCGPNPCPGACCNLTTGECTFVPQSACTTGPWIPGVCTPTNPCPRGACCDSATLTCTITGPAGCPPPRQFLPPGSTCMPNVCPVVCCEQTTGNCLIRPQSQCPGLALATPILSCTPLNPCPPVALCRNITIDATTECVPLTLTPADIDNGSHATIPNCPVTLALSPTGPFPVGQTTVTLTVTDCRGLVSTCTAVVTVLGDDCDHDGIPDICQCLWDNSRFARSVADINGQISHLGGAAGDGARVADDIYLCPGSVYRISSFSGVMLTNLLPELRKARLELFDDCDGRPVGEPVGVWETTDWTQLAGPNAEGYFLVRYDFDLCEEDLWLEGGTHWWSLIGLGTCGGLDLSSWVSSPSAVNGSPPVKADGTTIEHCYPTAFGPWAPLDECCIGCVNMTYRVFGSVCPIIWNNGPALTSSSMGAGGVPSENISQLLRSRGADDFVVKPCASQRVCLIDAWIWSNCDPVRGFVEIYDNDCREPARAPLATLVDPLVIPTGDELLIDGVLRQGYILRFSGLDLTLPGGRTYWLSAGADRTGSQASRTCFAFGGRCDTCPRHGFASQSYAPPLPVQWHDVGPDLAFRIGAAPTLKLGPGPGAATVDPCPADVNRSGSVTVQDIFDFLAAWFAGCP